MSVLETGEEVGVIEHERADRGERHLTVQVTAAPHLADLAHVVEGERLQDLLVGIQRIARLLGRIDLAPGVGREVRREGGLVAAHHEQVRRDDCRLHLFVAFALGGVTPAFADLGDASRDLHRDAAEEPEVGEKLFRRDPALAVEAHLRGPDLLSLFVLHLRTGHGLEADLLGRELDGEEHPSALLGLEDVVVGRHAGLRIGEHHVDDGAPEAQVLDQDRGPRSAGPARLLVVLLEQGEVDGLSVRDVDVRDRAHCETRFWCVLHRNS